MLGHFRQKLYTDYKRMNAKPYKDYMSLNHQTVRSMTIPVTQGQQADLGININKKIIKKRYMYKYSTACECK